MIDWAEPKYIQSEQDAQFFFTAANAIGAAISRESVYLEMDRKAGFLSFLGQLSLEGNKDQSFNDLHKNLTTLLTEFSRAEHVIILCKELIDTDANQVPPDIVQVYQELEDSLLPVSLSPADEAFPESFLDFKAVISFPIISTQVFLGGIIFFFKDFKTFRTDEIEDYLQVINQIGLILAKAKNLTMLEAHVKERTPLPQLGRIQPGTDSANGG